jgi:hypothetical protein
MKSTPLLRTAFLLIMLGALAVSSCKKDDNDEPCLGYNLQVELGDEAQAATTAGNVYVQDPTVENCIAYRNALQAYYNAAEDQENCAKATGFGTEWAELLQNIQTGINDLQC